MAGLYDFSIRECWDFYSDRPLSPMEGKHKVCCIVHSEDRPSAVVNTMKNTFVCYVCDLYGDAVDLIKAKEGYDTATAVQHITEVIGVADSGIRPGSANTARGKPAGLFGSGPRPNGGNNPGVPSRGRGKPPGLRR